MDVPVTITIPDAHTTKVLNTYLTLAGKRIELMVHGENFNGNWTYTFDTKDAGESNTEFAKRVFSDGIKAMVKLVDLAEDQDRYRSEVAALTPAAQDVVDGILE